MNKQNQQVRLIDKLKEHRQDLIVLTVISLFIGFLAPFGMTEVEWYQSVAFWFVVCFLGYLIYRPLLSAGAQWLSQYLTHIWLRTSLCLLIASALMALAVPAIVFVFFGFEINYQAHYLDVFTKCLVIGGAISGISIYKSQVNQQKQQLAAVERAHSEQQKQLEQLQDSKKDQFMQHLPVDKRGMLYCLEMSDHYVKVYTDKGHHMLLMRFKDALTLLESNEGLQTHRSWWVATDAVKSVKKVERKLSLQLVNDLEVPVSRTYQGQVKAAGIF